MLLTPLRTVMLDSSQLREYIATFNGYGDYQAKYWFVGMEEGGGGSFEEIARRFANWEGQGRGELSDLVSPQSNRGLSLSAGGSGRLQTTWSQLIRIVLASEGKPTDNASVRGYQQSKLGRVGGETCLLELMPLPSPNAGKWLYSQYSDMPDLQSRSEYMRQYAEWRADRLRSTIEAHKPPVVVFYSLGYMKWWKRIAGVEFNPTPIGGVKTFSGRNEHTEFFVIPQPSAPVKGKGNAYYVRVGKAIAESLRSRRAGDNI
jgi:hypothetical protein